MTTTKPFLDIGEVEYIDNPHNDLTVVNAARVSNGKRVSRLVTADSTDREKADRKAAGMGLDDGLIRYLATYNHWTPFGHVRHGVEVSVDAHFDWSAFLGWAGTDKSTGFNWHLRNDGGKGERVFLRIWGSLWGWFRNTPPLGRENVNGVLAHIASKAPISAAALDLGGRTANEIIRAEPYAPLVRMLPDCETFRIKAPLFVVRQWMRSTVGIVYNEVSRRYVDDTPEYHIPADWRGRPDKGIKQGSGASVDDVTTGRADERFSVSVGISNEAYHDLLGMGIAPEQARAVLPTTMGTELWMTATHSAIRRILSLRLPSEGGHPQYEIVKAAEALSESLPSGIIQ